MIVSITYKFGLPQSTFLPKNIGLGTVGRIELGHSEWFLSAFGLDVSLSLRHDSSCVFVSCFVALRHGKTKKHELEVLPNQESKTHKKRVFWDTRPWTWWIMHLCWQLKSKQISAICQTAVVASSHLQNQALWHSEKCQPWMNKPYPANWLYTETGKNRCIEHKPSTFSYPHQRYPHQNQGLNKGLSNTVYQSFTTVFPEWGSCMNHGGLLWVSLFETVLGRFPHLISHAEFNGYPTHLDTSDVNNYSYMIHTPLNPVCPLFCRFEPQVLPKENWVVLWVSGIYIYNICKYPPHTKIHLQDFTTINKFQKEHLCKKNIFTNNIQ